MRPIVPKVIRGVLLDVDGTLVDSNEAHARAWQEALREGGYDVSWARVRRLIGMGADKLVPLATGLAHSDVKARWIVRRRSELFQGRELDTVRPLPRVRDLLLRMRGEGLRWEVATSARSAEVRPLLERAGVLDLVPLPPDEVKPSKPDPDVVHSALDRLGVPAREVVMLGDTPYDVEAAYEAHVASIAFRTGGWPDVQLAGAVAIYDGPWDLLARFGESVLKGKTAAREAKAVVAFR